MDIVRNSLGSEIRIIWNSIDATYKNAFWLVMVFSLLAWGAELVNHTDNVDDYIQSMIHSPMVWTQLGRWGADILYFYGLGGWYMPTLHLLIGLIVNTSTILIAIYYFSHGRKTSLSNIVLPAGLYVTFPYLTDVFGFNTAQVLIPLSNLLVICGYILARKELFPFLISALSMTLAASLYQISLNTLTIAIVSHLMFLLVYSGSFSQFIFYVKDNLLIKYASMIAGVFIYIVSLKIAFNIFPKTNSRFSAWDSEHIVDTIPELLIKLARIKSYIEKHLFIEDYLLSSTTKYAIVILIMGAIIAAILLILRKTNRDRALRIAVFLILFPCLFIAIYATDILTLKELLRMGYRHTSSIAMAYALLAFLCLSATQNQFVKNIYSIVTIFVLAQFIYTANIWWYSQSKLNEFDETLLNRILTRIETNPEFTNYKDQAIVFVGKLSDSEKPENYSLSTSHKPIKPIYQSAFQASWSQRGIFATKGIRLKKASEKDVLAAYEYAQRHEVWPHKESVAIENDLIIIVFENTDQP